MSLTLLALIFPALLTTAKRYMKEEVLTNIYQKTIYGVPEDITKTNSIRMLPAALSVKSAITAALIRKSPENDDERCRISLDKKS